MAAQAVQPERASRVTPGIRPRRRRAGPPSEHLVESDIALNHPPLPRLIHVASGREWRGGQRQVWLLAKALSESEDLTQFVMTSRGSELERRLAESGVPVHGAPWRIGLDPRALFALLRLIPDSRAILHAHDSHALTLATIATRIRGGRIVATRRVDFHLRRPGQWKRADRVVAISNAVRNVLIADGVSTSRITVVHSGVDLEAARTTPAMDVRSGIRAEPGAILAVSVGALVGHKDHATMVETARLLRPRFPNLHWAVAGDGPERTRLASQIAAAGLTDQFHLLGAIPDGVPLIAAGDVYVASSSEEGLGTSLIDALARGIPVVATDAGGIPELLGDRAGIVCPRRNPQALAVGVERVLADPALARRLREAGPVRAQALSHVRMAEALRSVYRSLDSDA